MNVKRCELNLLDIFIDGCEWDLLKRNVFILNKLTDDDGNPLVDKVGCVKCDDIRHSSSNHYL